MQHEPKSIPYGLFSLDAAIACVRPRRLRRNRQQEIGVKVDSVERSLSLSVRAMRAPQ